MPGFSDYEKYDGLGLAELVRKKEVTALELCEEAILRMDRINPKINAVIYRMDDAARAAARGPIPQGPFSGVPFSSCVKCLLLDGSTFEVSLCRWDQRTPT